MDVEVVEGPRPDIVGAGEGGGAPSAAPPPEEEDQEQTWVLAKPFAALMACLWSETEKDTRLPRPSLSR